MREHDGSTRNFAAVARPAGLIQKMYFVVEKQNEIFVSGADRGPVAEERSRAGSVRLRRPRVGPSGIAIAGATELSSMVDAISASGEEPGARKTLR